jgi:hypothetical protein
MKTRGPLQTEEQTRLEALYRDLDLFLTQPMLPFDDQEPMVAGDLRKELGRLKSQISRVEKALEGLPRDARPDQVIEALEERGILQSGRMSETE